MLKFALEKACAESWSMNLVVLFSNKRITKSEVKLSLGEAFTKFDLDGGEVSWSHSFEEYTFPPLLWTRINLGSWSPTLVDMHQ